MRVRCIEYRVYIIATGMFMDIKQNAAHFKWTVTVQSDSGRIKPNMQLDLPCPLHVANVGI
jgi:hypothetical protein